MQLSTIVTALGIFYSLLGASLLVPVLGAFAVPNAGAREAIAAIAGGIGTLLVAYFATDGKGWSNPALWGLIGSAISFTLSYLARPGRVDTP